MDRERDEAAGQGGAREREGAAGTLPRVERASAKLATAFQVVFDTTNEQVDTDTREITRPKVENPEAMWEAIEQVVSRHELAAAIAALSCRCVQGTTEFLPAPTLAASSLSGDAPYWPDGRQD